MFGPATVKQVRNTHSYIKDMDEEYQLYHQSGSFVRFLAQWTSSYPTLIERIAQLANDIAHAGFWKSSEVEIINAWLQDLNAVGYRFPALKSQSSMTATKKRVAICVTRTAECIDRAWRKTEQQLRRQFDGDVDTFLFLSSSNTSGPVPIADRLKEARAFSDSAVTVIYEERDLHSNDPRAQQTWALGECSALVKEYAEQQNIAYKSMIHTRVDVILPKRFTLPNLNPSSIFIGQASDGSANPIFAFGLIDQMHDYMTKWNHSNAVGGKNHSSSFDIVPYGSNSCH